VTLVERIQKAIETDDEDYGKASRRLVEHYADMDRPAQAAINDAFICLCGWSLDTLIKADKTWEEENLTPNW
jgi:hypothetical protein